MINFRFHIVSLIAVFLALAVGVVFGATVVNSAIVDRLNNRIDTVEDNANKRKAESDQLRSEVGQLQGYIDGTKDFAVSARLSGVTLVTIATRGVDADSVKQTVELAQQAGARAPGIIWLEGKLTLSDADALKQLGELLGRPGQNAKATREEAWNALASRVATGGGAAANGRDLLTALADGGYISFEPVGDQGDNFSAASFTGGDVRVLLVDGTNGQITGNEVLAPLSNALVANRLRLVVGEVFEEKDGGPKRGAMLTPIRENDGLKQAVSTVDDLDRRGGPGQLRARPRRPEPKCGRTVRVRDGCDEERAGMVEPVAGARSVSRSAAGMGVAAGASRVIGFARVLAIAAILGTTYLGNTFTSSNYVSNVLFELLAAGALSAVLVPTLVDLLARPDEPEAERLAGSVLGIALIVLGAVTVVGVIAAPWLARLLSSGVDDPSIAAQQESLATFLLRFFVPQVLLYAIGTVAIAVLYAKRRFVVTAIAPIGNTILIVAGLVMFRVLTGGDTSLDLSLAEKLTLALSATLGVAAFVAVPSIALHRTGFRLRPRLSRGDPEVNRLLRLSGWAILQHAEIGLLLGAAIVLGNSVEGGTVAYQVAWVFFLAPYGVIAQPIHTAIHNELSLDAARADLAAFARSLRWALDAMAVLIVPVSAAMIALARPAMIVFAFGESAENGVNLLAAGARVPGDRAVRVRGVSHARSGVLRARRQPDAGRRRPGHRGVAGSSRWVSACG